MPAIIEGETGSSKSLSAEITCGIISNEREENEINKYPYIKCNLSAQIKISDLMKTQTGHKAFLSGIKIILLNFLDLLKKEFLSFLMK